MNGDAGGNVIVVDSGNDRLQVFTPDGKALTQCGRSEGWSSMLRTEPPAALRLAMTNFTAPSHGTSAKVKGALRLDQGCNKSKHVRRHVGDRRVSGLTQIKDGKLRALVRSRLSRYRGGQLGRSSRSCQNADGHCDLASARDRQNHRIVGYEGAPTHAWVRDGRKHARRICFSNPDGNRDTGKDHSRGRRQGLVAIGGKAGE